MLLPQFSFRFLLAAVTGAAMISLVAAAAVRGDLWAISVAVGVGGVVVCFMLFFLAFAVAFGIATVWRLMVPKKRATPFSGEAPRQLLPTQDLD